MRIPARTIVNLSLEDIWETLTGVFTIVFDDGEMEVNEKTTIYSRYAWEFHRIYPDAPIKMSHHLKKMLNGRRVSPSTHLGLIKTVLWDVYDHYCLTVKNEDERRKLRFEMATEAYEITNMMYNHMSYQLEEYVISLDVVDFIKVLQTREMMKMEAELQPTEDSIANAYSVISSVLRGSPDMLKTSISKLVRSNLISEKQLHQCLGPRGYLTDTDSQIFHHPILPGYIHGIRLFHDNIIESRSASKAMEFSKEPLQAAEYFSRRLQFVSQAVETLHHEDCGSTKYLGWYVRGREVRDGEVIYEGDLAHIAGKNYMDDDGVLKTVKTSDTHLVGRKINMRSVFNCFHPDPSGVCRTCFGEISDAVPDDTNLGQLCATYVTQQSSQAVLSVKHLDGSASVEPIVLSEEDQKFMEVVGNGNSYKLSDRLKGNKISLIVNPAEVKNLTDVLEIDEITKLPVSRITEIKTIGIRVEGPNGSFDHEMNVNEKRRLSSFTYDMLKHIREVKWSYVDGEYVCIDMTGWDYEKPILTLPLRTFNMSDHSREIAAMIESCVEDTDKRDNFTSPTSLLVDLFTLVNEKLSVNLAILEVVLYAAMIVSAEENDYALPKPWGKQGMGVMRQTMDYRNLAPRMAYERHGEIITNPATYLLPNRFDHIFDGLIMPREVLAHGSRTM